MKNFWHENSYKKRKNSRSIEGLDDILDRFPADWTLIGLFAAAVLAEASVAAGNQHSVDFVEIADLAKVFVFHVALVLKPYHARGQKLLR